MGASLTLLKLILPVSLLLVEHSGVVRLCLDIFHSFALSLRVLPGPLAGVFIQHLLQVHLLLLPLVGQHLALGIHFTLKAGNQVLVLAEFLLLHVLATLLFKLKLAVPALLLGTHFGSVFVQLGLLTGTQQSHMLLLHLVIGKVFFIPCSLLLRLVVNLPV